MPISEIAEILLQTTLSLFPEVDLCPTGSNYTSMRLPTFTSQSHPGRNFSRTKCLAAFIGASLIIFFAVKSLFLHDSSSIKHNAGSLSTLNTFSVPLDGFAGCLVIKDDNDRLSEWIAYHWLTLPLKYLVVAVDPTGNTSPAKILSLFNDTKYNLGMEIIMWNDVDFGHWVDEGMDGVHKHRDRQKRFLATCQKYHKARNRTWLAIVDPDEYLTFNILSDDDRDPERRNDVDVFGFIDGKNFTDRGYRIKTHNSRRQMTEENVLTQKTIFEYISENKEEIPWKNEPCYLVPRTLFSAIESPSETVQDAGTATYGLDANNFSTLKYFKHGEKGSWHDNKFGKVIIDLSRIDEKEITYAMPNIHSPLKSCYYPFRLYETGLLRVHHYLGSWEQYSARSDVRRSRDKFDANAFVNFGTDYQLQGWLRRFVEIVGEQNSKEILQHSGVIDRGNSNLPLTDQPDYGYIKVNPPSGAEKEEKSPDEKDEDGVEILYYYEEGKLLEVKEKASGQILALDDPRLAINKK